MLIEDLGDRFADLPTGAWDVPPVQAVAVPLEHPGEALPYGFFVTGLNRFRPFDVTYRGYVDLIVRQLAGGITRARAFESERQQREELAELDRVKTAFFTNVSHELRTPLTLLLGPAEDALNDTAMPLPPAQRSRVEVIERNAQRLLKQVNTLLDFSRLESGRTSASFEPLDLGAYTRELAEMFVPTFERAKLSFELDCADLPQPVYVDRDMWAKIVLNLVSNAFKATFAGGVRVRLTTGGDAGDLGAELQVTDTGVGIEAAEQGRLFERFHRVAGAASRSHEGSGIGLALVAEFTELHGGRVSVDSAPGRGSTFTVHLPFGRAHLPADQVSNEPRADAPKPAQYSAGYLAEAVRWLDADADPPAAPIAGRPGRHRVLVVDDNADMREYIAGLLDASYDVETAPNGALGLQQARAEPPDLVLTDVMMPELDGYGLLTALRSDPTTMHVPVVMLSARAGDDATAEGLEAGADDYLVKPFAARELLARVRSNLELDRVRRVADELEKSRELLDNAERLASVGSWELDLTTGNVTGSAEFSRIIGIEPELLRGDGLARSLSQVHPDDVARLRDALRSARAGGPLDIEVRVRPVAGEQPRLIRVHGVRQLDSAGRPERLRGSAQDITDQRQAEREVLEAAAAREAAAREHHIAEQLQRSLLPDRDFDAASLDIAAYYRAGVEGTQVGGDWYDVIELAAGRTALVLGDVMGRGVRAAAVMGQLRATVRAYARLDLPPDELLHLLDAAVQDISEDMIVTCIYAIYDPADRRLEYANAGHLPPLLAAPGTATRRLDAGGPPLGTGLNQVGGETVELPVGSTLMLYTDGLVEHRGSDIDDGIDRLAALLTDTDAPIDDLAGLLVQRMLPDGPDDDVAALVVRPTIESPTSASAAQLIPMADDAVRQARDFATPHARRVGHRRRRRRGCRPAGQRAGDQRPRARTAAGRTPPVAPGRAADARRLRCRPQLAPQAPGRTRRGSRARSRDRGRAGRRVGHPAHAQRQVRVVHARARRAERLDRLDASGQNAPAADPHRHRLAAGHGGQDVRPQAPPPLEHLQQTERLDAGDDDHRPAEAVHVTGADHVQRPADAEAGEHGRAEPADVDDARGRPEVRGGVVVTRQAETDHRRRGADRHERELRDDSRVRRGLVIRGQDEDPARDGDCAHDDRQRDPVGGMAADEDPDERTRDRRDQDADEQHRAGRRGAEPGALHEVLLAPQHRERRRCRHAGEVDPESEARAGQLQRRAHAVLHAGQAVA